MHEQNKEDNSDEVYQESEFIRVNVIIQQENDETKLCYIEMM